MNLAKLFEIQRELDQHIIEKKGLQGQDLLPKKILALQVELGELANEWRGFKFWSEDQEPRTFDIKEVWNEGDHGPQQIQTNPLLEEYVDALHFILSIGLEKGYVFDELTLPAGWRAEKEPDNLTEMFKYLIKLASDLSEFDKEEYQVYFYEFGCLGEKLGFTWEQIEESYFEKNRINHERQESGY